MERKHVIKADVEEKFVSTILQFAVEEGLTITNIKEAIEKVSLYMEENATLKDYRKNSGSLPMLNRNGTDTDPHH